MVHYVQPLLSDTMCTIYEYHNAVCSYAMRKPPINACVYKLERRHKKTTKHRRDNNKRTNRQRRKIDQTNMKKKQRRKNRKICDDEVLKHRPEDCGQHHSCGSGRYYNLI